MTFLEEEEATAVEQSGAPGGGRKGPLLASAAAAAATGTATEIAARPSEGGHTERSTATAIVMSRLWHRMRTNVPSLILGQILSLLLATAGATQATLHLSCGLSAPTFTVGLVYVALSLNLAALRWGGRGSVPTSEEPLSGTRPSNGGTADDVQQEGNDGTDHDVVVGGSASVATAAAVFGVSSTPTHAFLHLPIHAPVWAYAIIALLDVEANYLTVLAYRYTTLTSISLFDALAIPSAMVLSRLALRRTYRVMHLAGVAVCMVGVVVNVMQDYESDSDSSDASSSTNAAADDEDYDEDVEKQYPHKLRGDVLAILGGVLYGINDTVCETYVRTMGGSTEFLGMIGLFAGIISAVQAALLEREDIVTYFDGGGGGGGGGGAGPTCTAAQGLGLLGAFVVIQILSYTGAAKFLLLSEAAFFNLSLLTGDLWTVVFSVTAERIVPQPLFFVALTLIVGGVCLYEMAPSPVVEEYGTRWSAVDGGDAFELAPQDSCHNLT